jgi:hypothetical protein
MPIPVYKCKYKNCNFISKEEWEVTLHEVCCQYEVRNRMCRTCSESIVCPESGHAMSCHDFEKIWDNEDDDLFNSECEWMIETDRACCLIWKEKMR